jgi:two-component system response regulator MprA
VSARVLVVDDVIANVKLLEARLTAEYFEVVTAMNGPEALEICARGQCDIVLLDVMMPGMDGFEVCRRIKANPKTAYLPVIMITALDQTPDRIAGLEAGADDYLIKPFSTAELIARVRALLRRRRDLSDATTTRYADLILDHSTRDVRRGSRPVTLTRREFDLLALFMANPEVAMARTRLVAEAWGGDPDVPGTASVDVYVGYLRRKLEEAGEARLLHTVRGVGYQLRLPPEPEPEPLSPLGA